MVGRKTGSDRVGVNMFTKIEVLRYMTYAALCAVALFASFRMTQQDTMGLDGYIEYVRLAWVNTPVWLGWALMVVNAFALSAVYQKVVRRSDGE